MQKNLKKCKAIMDEKTLQKCFRMTQETLNKYNKLKETYRLKSDVDMFAKIVEATEMQANNKLVAIDELNKKDEIINKMSFLLGQKDKELELFNQIKEKGFFKRILFAISIKK